MSQSGFADFALEVLRPWRQVSAKRMFGGHGIYHAGVMFALMDNLADRHKSAAVKEKS